MYVKSVEYLTPSAPPPPEPTCRKSSFFAVLRCVGVYCTVASKHSPLTDLTGGPTQSLHIWIPMCRFQGHWNILQPYHASLKRFEHQTTPIGRANHSADVFGTSNTICSKVYVTYVHILTSVLNRPCFWVQIGMIRYSTGAYIQVYSPCGRVSGE